MDGSGIGNALWLEERRGGIGGTDAAAILGLSPFAGPLDVWLSKRGQAPPRSMTPAMDWGLRLEPVIAQAYTDKTGRAVYQPAQMVHHRYHPTLIGSLDRLLVDLPKGLEIKTASPYTRDKWGEEGTDQIPAAYVVQCAHYMALTGFNEWDVAVLIGGSELRCYTIKRDLELESKMVSILLEWWDRHVVKGERPPLGVGEAADRYLADRFPRQENPLRAPTPDEAALAGELLNMDRAIKDLDKAREELANRLKDAIGLAEGLDGDGWRITWKEAQGRRAVQWEEALRHVLRDLSLPGLEMVAKNEKVSVEAVLDRLVGELKEKFTIQGPPSRRFLAKGREEAA